MCKYLSWIETLDGGVHFLTDADMPRAGELGIADVDLPGHGAIRLVRGWADNAPPATEKECDDFSSPDNFPPAIAAAIREGRMTYGVPDDPRGLLTDAAYAKWGQAMAAADAKWGQAMAAADAERDRAMAAADAKRKRAMDDAYAKRDRAMDAADAKRKRAMDDANAERTRAVADANAERTRAVARYLWRLFADPTNRAVAWR